MKNIFLKSICDDNFTLRQDIVDDETFKEEFKEAFWSMAVKTPLPEQFVDRYFHDMNIEELIESDNLTKGLVLKHMDTLAEYLVSDDEVVETMTSLNTLLNKLSETPVQEFTIPLLESLHRVQGLIIDELQSYEGGNEYVEEYMRRFDIVRNALLQSSILHITNTEEMLATKLKGYPLTVYLMTNTRAIPLDTIHYKEIPITDVMQVVSDFPSLVVTDPKARTRIFEFIARYNMAHA